MNDLEFLKKQHLSMFEKKTDLHKTLVAKLYKEYIADKDVDTEDKLCLYSNFYLYFSKHFPAEIYEKECIVGTNWHWGWQAYVKELTVPHNGGHFIADYQDFLEKGIRRKTEEVCAIYKNFGFKQHRSLFRNSPRC